MTTRRAALIGLGAASTLAACSRSPARPAVDVVAAGQPAALLIWAVARDRLAGWPMKPDPDCLKGLPASAAGLPELGSLVGPLRKTTPEAVAALNPTMIIDYGDAEPFNVAEGEALSEQIGVQWHLIDGHLPNIPAAFRRAGELLDARQRGESLAQEAERILNLWHRIPHGPSFYYAKGADGLRTGFAGSLSTEVLDGAGWTNVAVGQEGLGRVTLDQVVAWDPEVLVTLSPRFVETAMANPAWRLRPNGRRRRILLMPDRPFGWVDRPPSVNRLLGCAWLTGSEEGTIALSMLDRRLYGMAPVESARPRWID